MARQQIRINQSFNAPIETVFTALTDHHNFGRVVNAKIQRIKDSDSDNVNGVGSIRRITPLPFSHFEETVITFEAGRLMEYKISKGSPVKNHKGRMEFFEVNGKTQLNYSVYFEPKIPFLGKLLKGLIERPLVKSLKTLAVSYG
ncbi:MAG: SRPBCC family protein [Bermanella sp.]